MRAVIGAVEGGGAVDAGKDGAVAALLVRVELGLLDDVVAGFAGEGDHCCGLCGGGGGG